MTNRDKKIKEIQKEQAELSEAFKLGEITEEFFTDMTHRCNEELKGLGK